MKLVTVMFDYGGRTAYHRLYEVFKASCLAVMPEVSFEPVLITPPHIKEGWTAGMSANVAKLREWLRVIEASRETVCFTDCDMIALKSVADADELDFDLAYTVRRISIPVNGGVVFVKPTRRGKEVMRLWNEIDDQMFDDHELHAKWRNKYAGMNQAAFGYLLENHPDVARMIPLPCATWNCCYEDWPRIDDDTRLVHVKGPFRRALLEGHEPGYPDTIRRLAKVWREYEATIYGPGYVPPKVERPDVRTAESMSQVFRRRYRA